MYAHNFLGMKMVRKVGIGAIIFYQLCISPLFPPSCRFYPTCSDYCRKAVEKYGLLKGSWLAINRLIRCHPFNPGGYDPVK